jgi:hypothetical protein
VQECPVDCIYERARTMYINPNECGLRCVQTDLPRGGDLLGRRSSQRRAISTHRWSRRRQHRIGDADQSVALTTEEHAVARSTTTSIGGGALIPALGNWIQRWADVHAVED